MPDLYACPRARDQLAAGPRLADAPPRDRSVRAPARRWSGAAAGRRPGPGRLVGGARHPRPQRCGARRRGRRRARPRCPHQDVGDAGHAPPPDTRGCGADPFAARQCPAVGAAIVAALFRDGPRDDGALPRRRDRGARRPDPHPRATDRGGRHEARDGAPGRAAPLGLGCSSRSHGRVGSALGHRPAIGSRSSDRIRRARAGRASPTRRSPAQGLSSPISTRMAHPRRTASATGCHAGSSPRSGSRAGSTSSAIG